jgi:acyl-coenzyme A thioesterase PaaI-like protein
VSSTDNSAIMASRLERAANHPTVLARRRAADAVRALIDQLVRTDLDPAAYEAIAGAALALGTHFDGATQRVSWADAVNGVNGVDIASLMSSPVMGPANPIAPPLDCTVDGDAVVGLATFGAAYEGPPGCVHGGIIAAAFDEILGTAQAMSSAPGMTGRLTVNYRSPTPLDQPIRFTGRLDRVEGRKVFTVGRSEVQNPDGAWRLCAEAEGLFISIDFERMRKLIPGASQVPE